MARTAGSGIGWPPGPYQLADQRQRRWVRIGGWALIVAAILMITAHGRDRWVPQDLADLAASLGIGHTVEGAAVESWHCGPYRRDGFWERAQRGIRHECLVRVRGAVSHDYEFRTGYSAAYDPGRVATVGGRIAVAWPGGVMFERLTSLGVTVVIGLLMILFGIVALRAARAADRFAAPGARIVDADLLRRRLMPRAALWDFAYDHGGGRVLGKALVHEDPVIADGIVTRGAAIVEPGGTAQLLTVASARPVLPAAVEQAVAAAFHAHRAPLDPGFDALVARTPSGPERDYVAAFGRAWHAHDVARTNAAIEDRHLAALALEPSRVDALLRDCRRFIA